MVLWRKSCFRQYMSCFVNYIALYKLYKGLAKIGLCSCFKERRFFGLVQNIRNGQFELVCTKRSIKLDIYLKWLENMWHNYCLWWCILLIKTLTGICYLQNTDIKHTSSEKYTGFLSDRKVFVCLKEMLVSYVRIGVWVDWADSCNF